MSNEQIAHNIGINQDTLYTWIKKYPEFSEALSRGKEVVDIEVENALLKRAKGYDYIETTSELIADKNAKNKAVMSNSACTAGRKSYCILADEPKTGMARQARKGIIW